MSEDISVARLAQQTAHLACLVIVVDREAFPTGAFRSLADVAESALSFVDLPVLLYGDPVGLLDPTSVRSVAPLFDPCTVVCGAPWSRIRGFPSRSLGTISTSFYPIDHAATADTI